MKLIIEFKAIYVKYFEDKMHRDFAYKINHDDDDDDVIFIKKHFHENNKNIMCVF